MNVLPLSIEELIAKLDSPFSLVRYGDGEFYSLLGQTGKNCDGADYGLPNLRKSLKETLTNPRDYLYGIGPKVMNRKNGTTEQSVQWIDQNAPQIKWHTSETILEASLAGELKPFIQKLGKIMIVGNERLNQAPIPFKVFVQVPSANAWLQYDEILYLIRQELYQVDTVLFCAGFLSKVAIWDLFPSTGKTHTCLDVGSTLDMYCGVNSRSYARKLPLSEIERLKALNF